MPRPALKLRRWQRSSLAISWILLIAVLLLQLVFLLKPIRPGGQFLAFVPVFSQPSAWAAFLQTGWRSKLKKSLFRAPPPSTIEGHFFNFPNPLPPAAAAWLGHPLEQTANGLSLWITDANAVRQFRSALEKTGAAQRFWSPTMAVASGSPASVFAGAEYVVDGLTNLLGTGLDALPSAHPFWTELQISAFDTRLITNRTSPSHSAVGTNFALSARLQIPMAYAAFLLSSNETGQVGLMLFVHRP